MSQPKLLSKPWAVGGLKNEIPASRTGGVAQEAATYTEGFPSITMTPIAMGGKPPSGKDMNGVLYELSAHTVYLNQGSRYRFDQDFCNAIGGYPKDTVLMNNAGTAEYISLINGNTADFNVSTVDINGKWAVWSSAETLAGKADKTVTVTAGNGLSGGGNLAANPIISLGTPGTLTAVTTNSVSADSHTHAIATASLTAAGVVQLSNATDSTAEDRAATPKAVKAVHDYAVSVNSAAQQALDGKAALVHRHTTADIDGLDVALAGIAVPAGTIVYIGGTTAPAGWLKLNGAVINVSAYPVLTERVWVGDADNATADYFYRCNDPANPHTSRSASGAYLVLADARGEFIRGWDDGRGVDVGRKLGTWQKGSGHTVDVGPTSVITADYSNSTSGAPGLIDAGYDVADAADYPQLYATTAAKAGIYRVQNTVDLAFGATRPRNLAALAIIKI